MKTFYFLNKDEQSKLLPFYNISYKNNTTTFLVVKRRQKGVVIIVCLSVCVCILARFQKTKKTLEVLKSC